MKIKFTFLATLLIAFNHPNALRAADGTWINSGGGSWTNTANWSGGIVADGSDGIADFSTLGLGADATVTLDGARTIGTLAFGDVNGTYNWTLGAGSGGPLTLAVSSGSPVISNSVFTLLEIDTVLEGNQGFLREAPTSGAGNQLLITSSNPNLSGDVILGGNQELTAITTPLSLGTGRIIYGSATGDPQKWLVAAGGDLVLTNDIEIRSFRALIGNQTVGGLTAGNQTWDGNVILNHGNANVHDIYAQKNLTINGTISEAIPDQQCVFGAGTITVNGPITSTGTVIVNNTVVALNGPISGTHGLMINLGNTTLRGTNTYTGGTSINGGNLHLANPSANAIPAGAVGLQGGGRIYLDNSNQIDDSDVIQFNNVANNNARLELTGFNETLAGIQDNAPSGNRIIEAASDGVPNAPATLTLNVPDGQSYKHRSYIRNGTGAGSVLSITKSGLGQQTFAAGGPQVSYSGTTTVEQGILEVSGNSSALNNSPVVLNGGTLLLDGIGTAIRSQPITGNGTLITANGGVNAVVLDTGTTNTFTGSTIVSNGTFQVKGVLSGSAASVYDGNLEILGELDATSVAVNGGYLISGNSSTFTSLIAGPVTVNGGTLRGWATVSDATLQSGTINPANVGSVGTLTVSNLTCQGGTLAFDLDPYNTTTGSSVNDLLQVDTLSVTGPTMIELPNVSSLTGSRYVVMTYNTLAGGLPALNNLYLNPMDAGVRSEPSIDTTTPGEVAIVFANPGAIASSLTWLGGLNGNVWDLKTTTNWLQYGSTPDTFFTGDAVTFDDSSTNNVVGLATTVYPGLITFNNSVTNYTVSGAGAIVSSTGLNQTGTGHVTLGVPYQGGGVTNSGGGVLALTNASFGSGLEVDNGSTVVMTGSNYFNGFFALDPNNILGGTLIITNGGKLLAPVTGGSFNLQIDHDLLVVAGAGSTLEVPGVGQVAIGNSGSSTGNRVVLRDGGTWTNFPNNLVIAQASAYNNQLILTNGGRLVWNTAGTGNVLLGQGSGAYDNSVQVLGSDSVLDLNGVNLYSGRNGNNNVTTVDAGVITNCNNLNINDNGDGQGNGVNVLNGGRIYCSAGINMGANAHNCVDAFLTVNGGSIWANSANIGGNAMATGTALTITNGGSLTLSNILVVNNASSVVDFSSGTLTIGSATVNNGLAFTVGDGVNAATLKLTGGGDATFANDLIISANAALKGNGSIGLGNVTVDGALVPGDSVGSLTFSNNLTLAGSTVMELDKAGSVNDSVTVVGALAYGGTLTVTNLGATPLVAGDHFTLFQFGSQSGTFSGPPVVVSAANSSVSASFSEATGVLTIDSATSSIANNPTNISYTVSGNSLKLTWPGDHLGWYAQSNSVSLADTNYWFDIPNSNLGTNLNITISPDQSKVFYRLRYPN